MRGSFTDVAYTPVPVRAFPVAEPGPLGQWGGDVVCHIALMILASSRGALIRSRPGRHVLSTRQELWLPVISFYLKRLTLSGSMD